jgi:hypothetical protein
MTVEQFRITHSTLIEHYQFIEHHLEGIYASLSDKNFVSGLEDVETCNIRKIVLEIQWIESEKKLSIISQDIYDRIEQARLRRNYWCHNCYVDMVFKLNGEPKKDEDIKRLLRDVREAEDLRDVLFHLKQPLIGPKYPKLN